jgi:hypothetical protein
MLKNYLICRYVLNLVEEAISCLVLRISFLQAGKRIALALLNFARFIGMEWLGGRAE